MLQDIYPHSYHVAYDPEARPAAESIVLRFRGRSILLKDGEQLAYPRLTDLPGFDESRLRFLFRIDGEEFFITEGADETLPEPPAGYEFQNVQIFRTRPRPKEYMFAGLTAYSLSKWYTENKFCSACGAKTEHSKTERALVCPCCGRTVYPKICPVVCCCVTDGDRLLVTKYAGHADNPTYALVAGFMEVGETPEDTCRREVYEETGAVIRNLKYVASQPWCYTDILMLGFTAEADSTRPIKMQEEELSVAKWITRGEIAEGDMDFSLTNHLITMFKNREIGG